MPSFLQGLDQHEQGSALVQTALDRLNSLPLEEVKAAGIWRDRASYFLNIAYPSMQAMNEVTADDVYADVTPDPHQPVALYIHIPFCTAECYYCHYYKRFNRPQDEVEQYLDAVEAELSLHRVLRGGSISAASIYVGGGTPSYMTAAQIARLFAVLRHHVEIPAGTEISFEVHPESASPDRISVLQDEGVNRINIGIESFNDDLLRTENRRHSVTQAIEAYFRVKGAGFETVNLDLIYGLRGQDVSMWEESLDYIRDLKPDSATMYFLRLKRGTPEFKLFEHDPASFPTDAELLLMHAMNFERMTTELGYIQNPVDWFIRDRGSFHVYQDHNWRRSDETELLGLGASAYSYVNGWQYYNVNDSERYCKSVASGNLPVWKGERLRGMERLRRTVMLGIKMSINREIFKSTYDIDVVDAFPEVWRLTVDLGLVTISEERVSLTYLGMLLADEVGQLFYSDEMKRRMASVEPALVSTTWPQFNP